MHALKVGIVGAGHISSSHIRGWARADNAFVSSITDLDQSATRRQADTWKIPTVSRDLAELLDTCDVVDICTPPHTHAEIIAAAAGAGRHVLVEKPVVTQIEDWQRVRQSISEAGVELAVVHNIKFSRSVQKAIRWVSTGRIGRVLRLRRLFLTHPESDRMLTDANHWSHDLPGGRWFETLPHALYLTHALAGPLELEHVTGLATRAAPKGAPVDEVSIILRGESCIAAVDYSAHSKVNRRLLQIEGTDGAIEVDVLGDSAVLYRGRDAKWKRPWGAGLRDSASALTQWAPDRLAYLADRIRGRSPHSRLIVSFALHLQGRGPHPTPIEEIDYVVTMGDRIGRAIDAAQRG